MVLRTNEGGSFAHVAALARRLTARGHVVGFAGALPGPPDAEVFDVPIERNVSPGADLRTTRRLAQVYRRFRPDLVHAHCSKEGMTARLARLTAPGIPLVYTPHGYAFDSYFSSSSDRALYRTAETLAAPLATRVLCVCEAERRLAAGVGPASRTRVVHNGIDPLSPDGVNPFVESLRPGPVITCVTGVREGKGIETLIDATPVLALKFPDVTVALAGDGPLRPELEERVRKLGLESRFRFLGEVENVAAVLTGSDMFVLPSWGESFPYAVLEAASLGLPIVATDVGGVGEAVPHGDCALLVPRHDVGALAAGMLELLREPSRASRLGAAARARQLDLFTLDRMVDGTLGVYEEALNRTPVP